MKKAIENYELRDLELIVMSEEIIGREQSG
jgi:hypothetical protein